MSLRRGLCGLVLALTALAAQAAPALAKCCGPPPPKLPAGSYDESVENELDPSTQMVGFAPGTLHGSWCNPITVACGSATATALANGDITLAGKEIGNIFPQARADTLYYFEAYDPFGPIEAPVHVVGSLSSQFSGPSSNPGSSEAGVFFGTIDGGVIDTSLIAAVSSASSPPECTVPLANESYDYLAVIPTNTMFAIVSHAFGDSEGGVGSFSLHSDPMVTIDPALLALNPGLRLIFSPGVVPEPASWALMLAGLGGLGAVLRRSRQVVTS